MPLVMRNVQSSAAGETLREFSEATRPEEELDGPRRLLDMNHEVQTKIVSHDVSMEEVLSDQHLWRQKRSHQEEPEPPLIREEQLEQLHPLNEENLYPEPRMISIEQEEPESINMEWEENEAGIVNMEQEEAEYPQKKKDLCRQQEEQREATGVQMTSVQHKEGREDHLKVLKSIGIPEIKIHRLGPASSRSPTSPASESSPEEDVVWHEKGWQPNTIPFTATPGPRNAAAALDSNLPADFLELFLTDELLQHVVDKTNLYASQYFQANPEGLEHSRAKAWKPVSVPELKSFFGLTFLTGYIKKPTIELYWSVDEVDATPYFTKTMSRNRFQLIWKFLHYNDNPSEDAEDKMYKVRPVLDYIVEKFKELYQPSQTICIDEGMMQWRGRLSFRVYNPHKHIKYGIKSYVLCDSATGYCFNMRPYVGEESDQPEMVLSLLDRLAGHGYTLYMDNLYNSVSLCERLLELKTNVCASLRKSNGEAPIIKEVTRASLGTRGNVRWHNGRVMVVAWQDKRLVTTCHPDSMQSVDVWLRGEKKKVTQFKPECVVAHNSSMNGVERLDQNVAHYPFIGKSLNWSKKFVAYLFQLCLFNAYIIYRARNPGKCKSLLEFIHRVVKSWTAKQSAYGGRNAERRTVTEEEDIVAQIVTEEENVGQWVTEEGESTEQSTENERYVARAIKKEAEYIWQPEKEVGEYSWQPVKEEDEDEVIGVKVKVEEEEVGVQVIVEEEYIGVQVQEKEASMVERSREVPRTPRAPYKTDPDSRLDGDIGKHRLLHFLPTSKRARPSRRCRVCARRGKRRETKMWCESCCVPLHAGECFTVYHTRKNYV